MDTKGDVRACTEVISFSVSAQLPACILADTGIVLLATATRLPTIRDVNEPSLMRLSGRRTSENRFTQLQIDCGNGVANRETRPDHIDDIQHPTSLFVFHMLISNAADCTFSLSAQSRLSGIRLTPFTTDREDVRDSAIRGRIACQEKFVSNTHTKEILGSKERTLRVSFFFFFLVSPFHLL